MACILTLWLMPAACVNERDVAGVEETQAVFRTLPNPAAVKCVDDGFRLEPVIKNGVTVGYHCVDPKTGRECEVWDYFRGDCDFSSDEKVSGESP